MLNAHASGFCTVSAARGLGGCRLGHFHKRQAEVHRSVSLYGWRSGCVGAARPGAVQRGCHQSSRAAPGSPFGWHSVPALALQGLPHLNLPLSTQVQAVATIRPYERARDGCGRLLSTAQIGWQMSLNSPHIVDACRLVLCGYVSSFVPCDCCGGCSRDEIARVLETLGLWLS